MALYHSTTIASAVPLNEASTSASSATFKSLLDALLTLLALSGALLITLLALFTPP